MLWVIQTSDNRSFWNDPRRQWTTSVYPATHFRTHDAASKALWKRSRQKLLDAGCIVPYELCPTAASRD